MKNQFEDLLPKEKVYWIAALGVLVGMISAALILPGGDDLYRYYQPFEKGCLACGYVPYFSQWFLWPLLILEYPLTWVLWTALCLTGFMALARFTRVNPFLFLITFPFLGQIWLGQIDILICVGLMILLFSHQPFLRGLGITLALVKPQLTGVAILAMLLLEERRDLWKVFVVPGLALGFSLLIYGISWPVNWLQNAFSALPMHVWRLASAEIWKFGIILLPVPLLFKDRRKRMQVSLLVSSLSMPFFGVYSYIIFLVLETKWWAVPLSFAWLIAYPFYQANAMQFAWVLPLTMLFFMTRQELVLHRQLRTG